MIISYAKSCNACHLRDPKIRCDRAALNMTVEPVYRPGKQVFQALLLWLAIIVAGRVP